VAIVMVDTSVLIDHLRGRPAATACLRASVQAGDELWSITPVRTEILAGARAAELTRIEALFSALRWLEVTTDVADRAGELAARHVRSHPGVDVVDYLVAAATGLLDARLLTLNVKHFPMVHGLQRAYDG
jgi:predicted nucleic acid-binding protein